MTIKIGVNGIATAQVNTCTFFADIGSAMNMKVDAPAALRVVIVSGEVFISGAL